MTVEAIRLDHWELKDFDPGRGSAEGSDGWAPVEAPGDTYRALIAAGRLPDPFQGRNETSAAWVRDREWWWRTTFASPAAPENGDRLELVFDGLDTFASVYLDGRLLGRTDNMFRRHRFDISDAVGGEGLRTLAIRFDPPALAVQPVALPVWSAFTDRVSRSHRNQMRKAQFGWGWDWGPDLPTVGIWRPVRIERRPDLGIAGLGFETLSLSEAQANVRVTVDLEGSRHGRLPRLEITLSDPDGRLVLSQDVAAQDGASLDLAIDQPRLWWTADQGDQPLYSLTVRLFDEDGLLDEHSRRVGIRTVTLDTSPDPDEPGASFFRFLLNGRLIFAKGACWVPPTSFVAEVEPDRYGRLLGDAVGCNMNMIRVWGGGVYEPDLFYDLCDELGLLVWQDFMFACAHYPEGDPAFVESVRREAEDQIRRLRGHACLALWCGNNESQAMHRINADITGDPTPLSGETIYDDVLPALVAALDPLTPYWPGSPGGGPNPNSMIAGDVHDWTVWHGVPPIPQGEMMGGFDASPEGVAYTRYAEDTGRFISEFGIQASPALTTLARWMNPADLTLGSEGFLERVKDEARKADAMMIPVTGLPATLQDYIDFTQWTQAEGLKFAIEHFRRRAPHCSGALIWQLNDCWPCVSWSLIDFDGGCKASYHAVRRAFAPVLASFRSVENDGWELWVTNDRPEALRTRAVVELVHLDGRSVWRQDIEVEVPAGGHAVAWTGKVSSAPDQVLVVRSMDGRFASNRQLLAPIKDLALDRTARPVVQVRRVAEDELELSLTARVFIAFVSLSSDRVDVSFSDNHLDLIPGEGSVIVIKGEAALGPEDLNIRCWTMEQHSAVVRAELTDTDTRTGVMHLDPTVSP